MMGLNGYCDSSPSSQCTDSSSCTESLSVSSWSLVSSSPESSLENSEQIPPDLPARIVQLVEQYFTDESLLRNEYVRKNIRRNKEGYVNVSFIANLRPVKAMTKCYPEPCRLISYAIGAGSRFLELNDDGKRVRRRTPLPPVDNHSRYQRTVIVVNLPERKADEDVIYQDFCQFGQIDSVRFFDRQAIMKNKQNKFLKHVHRQLFDLLSADENSLIIAIVEFNTKCGADKCLQSPRTLVSRDPDAYRDVRLYMLDITDILLDES